jgi:putative effector of murein hydrolase
MVRFHKVSYFLQHVRTTLPVNTLISLYGFVNKFIQDNFTNTIITPFNLHTIAHIMFLILCIITYKKSYSKLFYINKEKKTAY